MPKVPLEKAFSLSTTHRLVLGETALDVPPLTLGRFLALTSCDFGLVVKRLLVAAADAAVPVRPEASVSLQLLKSIVQRAKESGDAAGLRETVQEEFPELLKDLGALLHAVDHHAFTEVACAIVPGLDAATWDAEANPTKVFELLGFMTAVHDWEYISETISYGKPKEAGETPTTRSTVAGALVAFCRYHPFYSPEQLLEMRIEGFFRLRGGAGEAQTAAEELAAPPSMDEESFADAAGAGRGKASSDLLAALDEADRKAAN